MKKRRNLDGEIVLQLGEVKTKVNEKQLEIPNLLSFESTKDVGDKELPPNTRAIYQRYWSSLKDFCDIKGLKMNRATIQSYLLQKEVEGYSLNSLRCFVAAFKKMNNEENDSLPSEAWDDLRGYLSNRLSMVGGKLDISFSKKHLQSYISQRLDEADFVKLQQIVSVILTYNGNLKLAENSELLRRDVQVLEDQYGVREVFVRVFSPRVPTRNRVFVVKPKNEVKLLCQYMKKISDFEFKSFYMCYDRSRAFLSRRRRGDAFFQNIPREVALFNNLTNYRRYNISSMHSNDSQSNLVDPGYYQEKQVIKFTANFDQADRLEKSTSKKQGEEQSVEPNKDTRRLNNRKRKLGLPSLGTGPLRLSFSGSIGTLIIHHHTNIYGEGEKMYQHLQKDLGASSQVEEEP
eukprot:snap_masked-scaffold_89-processed-gene-0.22-mRNA-1 protein AED:0.99 eAED:1.00 QI:0/-1/0/1/-1/1/1/0/403